MASSFAICSPVVLWSSSRPPRSLPSRRTNDVRRILSPSQQARHAKLSPCIMAMKVEARHKQAISGAVQSERIELYTPGAKRDINFGAVAAGRGRAIVLTSVAPGSQAEELGLKAGAQLVAMSDPFRPGEMSRLGDRASLRFVRDSIRLTASPTVTLEFVQLPPESVEATAPARSSPQDGSGSSYASSAEAINRLTGSSDEEDGSSDMADRSVQQPVMERRTDVESRIKARKDYLETVGQRDDSKLLGLLATLFFLPAGIILAVAFATGYLDALQAGSLGGF